MLCFREFLAAKFLKKRGKEYHKILWKFCLTVPKRLVGEQPFCAVFQKISGSENVLKKWGKEYYNFQSKVFCLTVQKFLVGEQPSCAVFQRISGSEKILKKRGKYQEFPEKLRCLTVSKNLVGEQPFCAAFKKISGSEKF